MTVQEARAIFDLKDTDKVYKKGLEEVKGSIESLLRVSAASYRLDKEKEMLKAIEVLMPVAE